MNKRRTPKKARTGTVLRGKHPRSGITAALVAALLFGASTPFAKALLSEVTPWLMAALLYIGSGVGLSLTVDFSAPRVQSWSMGSGPGSLAQSLRAASLVRCC